MQIEREGELQKGDKMTMKYKSIVVATELSYYTEY